MEKILVLGATGMLGSQVFKVLSKETCLKVVGTSNIQTERCTQFIVGHDSLKRLIELTKPDYVINCIGKIPQKSFSKSKLANFIKMLKINSLFSISLSNLSKKYGFILMQIQTDCVYKGNKGPYSEKSKKNALDIYGLTKRMGERSSKNQINIRTSIVGRETNSCNSLFAWLENTSQNSYINGYVNHLWNGVTTNVFAKLCHGIIMNSTIKNLDTHLVPADYVSKYELLNLFKQYLNRSDIKIIAYKSPSSVDRRLHTVNQDINNALWSIAGYKSVPRIEELVREMILESNSD
jgi:dTDP-4-dehydrorhamnose reductase